MIPYTLDHKNRIEALESTSEDISKLYWGILAEIPTMFVAWYFADSFIGRKYSQILFFFLSAVFLFLLLFLSFQYLIILTSLAKFSIAVCYIILYSYTLEVFDTSVRVSALGITSGIGRSGGILFPFILIQASNYSLILPYFILFVLSLVACLVNFKLPYDTKGKNLDEIVKVK
jgi:presenilin-like A22 family membrane protease